MPLFRSHSNGDTASRRSDLDRQIGCIAGFFQIFDPQVRAKQIAGPRKEQVQVAAAPHEPPPTTEPSSVVPKEDDSNLRTPCADGKVVIAKGNARALSDACLVDGEPQVLDSIQSTNSSNHDSPWVNPSQPDKQPHRPSNKAAVHVREEPAKANAMVRHSSFNERESNDYEIAFSPRRGNVAAYAARGRRISPTGSNAPHGSSFVETNEDDNMGRQREEDKQGYWSSPASHWPSVDGMQSQNNEALAGGGKNVWLLKGGRVAERQWAAEDSLEEWKQSLRALARLKEDEEAEAFRNSSGLVAPRASPRALRNELPPTSPARASAFDFKEVVRWSQLASSHAESTARRSWDDRDLPRSIAELRDAINARSRAVTAASPPPSPRPPSVVARLMGLENLPQEQGPLIKSLERKPSGEAKLLQQLLQCSPSPARPPLPPSPSAKAQQWRDGLKIAPEYPTSSSQTRDPLAARSELQSMLKRIESMSPHANNISTISPKPSSTNIRSSKPNKTTGAEPHSIQPPLSKKSILKNHLPVVVLKQSEEIRNLSSRPNHGYHDEIERRLRQLGLQSSEQERKTLKQILEAMQHKGLLKPPDGTKASDGTRRQQAIPPGSSPISLGHTSPTNTNGDGAASFWSSPRASKPAVLSSSSSLRHAKRDGSASIVIMRPLSKSVSKVPATNDNPPFVNERSVASPSKVEKITLRKSKLTVKSESGTLKESSSSRPKSRPSSTSPLVPASLHTPVPTRKISLKRRQGQIHVVKGPSQAVSFERARKSNTDMSTLRRSREQVALSQNPVKPVSATESAVESTCTPDDANYGDISDLCGSDDTQSMSMQPESPSDGSLVGDPLSQETTMEDEVEVATPPREFKISGSFGAGEDCFAKEAEQCSPVSVLDTHLSYNEAVESPECKEDYRLRDYHVDVICGPLLEEVGFPPMIAQTIGAETFSKIVVADLIEEPCADTNVELLDVNVDTPLASGASVCTALVKEGVVQHCLDCDHIGDDGGRVESKMTPSASEDCPELATWEGNSAECLCRNHDNHSQIVNECATDIAGNMDECARVMYDNASNDDEMLPDACTSNGEETDGMWTRNVDYCYTEDMLRGARVVMGPGAGWCSAEGWLAGGGEIVQGVYEELEEQWDALEEENGCIEDRDMGGELYLKSQQASMRRRLLFDCVNEILEERFSWVGMPGACGSYRPLSIAAVWGDLQRMEEGPCSAEDSMYAMLEQDLLHDADYSSPQCWNGMPTQLASVALHLEHEILDSLVLEALPALPHAPYW